MKKRVPRTWVKKQDTRGTNNISVCVVGLRGFPDVIGGVETHCAKLLEALHSLFPNLEITVLARRRYVGPSRYTHCGAVVIPLRCPGSKYFEAASHTLIAVFYACFRVKAKVLHIHAIGPGLFTPLARIFGFRVVVTHHGEDYRRQKWNWFAKRVLKLGEVASVLFAHDTIAVSRSLANRLRADFPGRANRIHYIPNGSPVTNVDCTNPDQPSVLQELGLKKHQFVLSVGRLVPEKGFEVLVSAFSAERRAFKLVIVGDTDHPDAFSRDLKRRACDDIRFPGRVFGSALSTLYQNASLFVLASSHEGLPISALEALSFGTPVLLSNIEAHTDLLLPSVCYFRMGDKLDLSKKLGLPHSLFAVDPAQARPLFDWRSVAEQTMRIYGFKASLPRLEAACVSLPFV